MTVREYLSVYYRGKLNIYDLKIGGRGKLIIGGYRKGTKNKIEIEPNRNSPNKLTDISWIFDQEVLLVHVNSTKALNLYIKSD